MRPDRNARAASISASGLGILPIGSVGMATIGTLLESMRRSHGKRSATRRRIGSRNRWFSSGASVVLREPAGVESTTTPTLAPLQAGARSPPFNTRLVPKNGVSVQQRLRQMRRQDASLVASRFGAVSHGSPWETAAEGFEPSHQEFCPAGLLLSCLAEWQIVQAPAAGSGARSSCHSSRRAIAIGQSGTIPDAKAPAGQRGLQSS